MDKEISLFLVICNSLPPTVHDPSLTETQFCAPLKTVLFCGAYETLPHAHP